jgi:hypothetical protein
MDVPKSIEFNGVEYRLMSSGRYYLSQSTSNEGRRQAKSLHVAIWEHHNQKPVPPRHEIHHIDEDPFNNDPENLECLPVSVHRKLHGQKARERGVSEKQASHLDRVRPLASEWHKTEEGKAWHSRNAKQSWANRASHPVVCVVCGETFEAFRPEAQCCSTRCIQRRQTQMRTPQIERRSCIVCGQAFDAVVQRPYSRTRQTCSNSCRARARQLPKT